MALRSAKFLVSFLHSAFFFNSVNQMRRTGLEGDRARRRRVKTVRWDTLHKEGVPLDLIIQVLCCFLLLLLFCHMALEVCFQIFRSERFDNTYAVVVDVDNLITLAVEVVSG